ncbi:MAG: hypothetical protein NVSMB64_08010 [Candidatus Velthaea sp.]
MLLRSTFALTLSVLLGVAAPSVASSPTPVPGGADQIKAMPGKVGETLFNGTIRFTLVEFRDATADDHVETLVPSANQKAVVMTTLVRNGSPRSFTQILSYTLADKDDVAFLIPDHYFAPNPLDIQQGAAARQRALFLVDKTFVPVKLLVQCPTCNAAIKFKAYRIALPPPPA